MDIKTALKEEHSKTVTMQIVRYIGTDHERFKALMDLFLGKDNRLSQRASWAVGFCGLAHPELIYPHLKQMLANLDKPVHDAIKRNTVRILADMDYPEDMLGEIADVSFRLLDDPKEAVAVRIFSMSVCLNITKREPDLANELKIILEDHYPHGSAGFKSRAKKILKELRKMDTSSPL
ncbi:MAG: hypothetical protein ACI8P3_000388 [Saprospiraceae bacterium]|jgi:hypothetical protein